ncbi:MAG: GDSL-like Lipase/Acylhydrolase, partial [Paenibacillus sp.]|nr:GDSL-like Lipase/Acylhydrolase [Paenibacillus sp.]
MPSLWTPDGIPDSLTVLFLGDSITQNHTYVDLIDAHFKLHWPEKQITLINLGLSSETVSGLSEPTHPFPRPCVHDRIEPTLKATQPDWVVIGYGMNDGIYHPFSEDRFDLYRQGILRAIELSRQYASKVILLTPPPFDADPFIAKGVLQPAGAELYDYAHPYEHYDSEVLARYAEWILSLDGAADAVVNIRAPLAQYTAMRKSQDP